MTTTTLQVVLDQMLAPVPGGIGRYAEELTRGLIATAPTGCDVEGLITSHSADEQENLRRRLPGLADVIVAPLGRREYSLAWEYGIPLPMGRGMIHAPSLFAPLRRHGDAALGEQSVVTIHDAVPWTHPHTLKPHGVAWHKAMAKRAKRYADAVVVPSHAVAERLNEYIDFGDRVRVIGGAASSTLVLPTDPDQRAAELRLPERYLLSVGTAEPRKGLPALISALGHPEVQDLPLLVVGPRGWGDVSVSGLAAAAGLAEDRVRVMGLVSDEDLAVMFDRAAALVYPSLAEGFGLPIVEAFRFGTPVIHSDDPALLEVSAGAGLAVARDEPSGYSGRLAGAIGRVLTDSALAHRLSIAAADRARAFSWRDSAERVWQLHADL